MSRNKRKTAQGSGSSAAAASRGWTDRLPSLPGGAGPWRWLGFALLLWLVLAVLYPGPMFRNEVFLSADSSNSDAFTHAGDAADAAGPYPLWNPYLFAGMPSFGSLAYVKYLYPPAVVFNFLQQKMGMAPLTWMITHLLFGGLGMIWLLSRWKLPAGALFLGAVIWLLFPKVVAWGVHGHGSKLLAAMYLPWLVGLMLNILDRGQLRTVGWFGLLIGLQLLSGHVQIAYYSLITLGWIGLWHTLWPLGGAAGIVVPTSVRWRRIGLVILGGVLGFMIASVMLLPVQEYARISIRGQDTEGGGGVGLDYATGWSLAPEEIPTMAFPAAAGYGKATYLGRMPFNDYPNYLGLLVLLLAAGTLTLRDRSLAICLWALALLAVMVALGNFGFGLYELMYRWLPFFNKFRIPSMVLILVAFAAAILAARMITAWTQEPDATPRHQWWPIGLGAIGAILLVAGAANLNQTAFLSSLSALAAKAGKQAPQVLLTEAWGLHRASLIRTGLLLMTSGAAFFYATKSETFRKRQLVWVVAVIVAGDLLGVDRLIVNPEKGLFEVVRDAQGGARLAPASALGREFVPSDPKRTGPGADELVKLTGHQRIYPLGNDGMRNTWMSAGIRSLGGYHAAKLAAYEPVRSRLYSGRPAGRISAWLSASVVVFDRRFVPEEMETLITLGFELEPEPANSGAPSFYRNLAALPRARLVDSWTLVAALPEKDALEPFLDGIQDGTIPAEGVIRLSEEPVPAPRPAGAPLPVPDFVTDALNEVILKVEAPGPVLLLLADMMAPGWKVQVDGQERDILTADLILRAVALDAGPHEVRFFYEDASVRKGLILSLAGLLGVVLLMGVPFLRRSNGAVDSEAVTHE